MAFIVDLISNPGDSVSGGFDSVGFLSGFLSGFGSGVGAG